MPTNFLIALGAVFGVSMGIVGCVWLTTRPKPKAQTDSVLQANAHD